MDGNHLVVMCTISLDSKEISTHALIDCGATSYAFIDQDFANHHHLPLHPLKTPRTLEVIDGRKISSGDITHIAEGYLSIQEHREKLPMFVTKLGHYPIVLGIPWFQQHDVAIRFASNLVTFGSQYCLALCNDRAVTVQGTSEEPPEPLSANTAPLSIAMIGPVPLTRQAKRNRHQINAISLYEINKALKAGNEMAQISETVPAAYHKFLPLFSEAEANELPPHCPYDHRIPLKEGFTPPFGPIYSLSRTELEALKKWLEENLSKGFIRASSSRAGAPFLLLKKGDGSLRLCVDYRGPNEGTIKSRYPLPLLHETLLRLQTAKYYTTLDIRGAYNLVRMAEGEEWKTAFRMRYGLFESLVMPFGLTNAPASFQHFINDVLRPYLDIFVTAYLDDVLIYRDNLNDHRNHVLKVLEALSEAVLHLKPEKREFYWQEVKYLRLIISTSGTKIDPAKVTTIQEWPIPRNVKDVQSFLGFANFYRCFVKGYSNIVAPMTRLTRKNTRFVWSEECSRSVKRSGVLGDG
jgi:predicted aspartyl protease